MFNPTKILLSSLILTAVTAQAAVLTQFQFAGSPASKTADVVAPEIANTPTILLTGLTEDTSRSGELGLTSADNSLGTTDLVVFQVTLSGADTFDFDTVDGGTGEAGSLSFIGNYHNGGRPSASNYFQTSVSLDYDPNVGTTAESVAAATWITLSPTTPVDGADADFSLAGLSLSGSSNFAVRIDLVRDATWNDAGIDDLTLSGLVVIPEPSTYAALFGAMALTGVLLHRRRG